LENKNKEEEIKKKTVGMIDKEYKFDFRNWYSKKSEQIEQRILVPNLPELKNNMKLCLWQTG
jgi:thymidylate synthase